MEDTRLPTEMSGVEDPYRATFDRAGVGIAHVGSDGRWLRVNPQLCAIVGYSEEEMRARTLEDFTHPDDLPTDLALVQRMFAGEADSYTAERRYRRKGGFLVWIQLTASVVPGPSGEPAYLVLVIEDISERKGAEEQGSAEGARILENLPDAFLTLDRAWRVQDMNPAAERLLGGMRGGSGPLALTGRNLWEALPEAMETGLYRESHRAMAEQVAVELEEEFAPLGLWLEMRAYPFEGGLAISLRDLTERKRREEEQARLVSEARWNAAEHALLREVLASVTEGRLRLCDSTNDLPAPLIPVGEPLELSARSLWKVRRRTQDLAVAQKHLPERWQDLVMAVGAAAVNAVTHAGSGVIEFHAGTEGTVQVWIRDNGPGIAAGYLDRGASAQASPDQQGFWMLLKAADRAFLLTNTSGTTIVLEQERYEPEPDLSPEFGFLLDPGAADAAATRR
jgi:PAS domain S-box-containing protein